MLNLWFAHENRGISLFPNLIVSSLNCLAVPLKCINPDRHHRHHHGYGHHANGNTTMKVACVARISFFFIKKEDFLNFVIFFSYFDFLLKKSF
jgi:hypothetical protein